MADIMADIMGIGDALNSNVAEKAYDDAISKAAKQFGAFGGDFFKAARLVLFPIQIAAAMQDKLERTLEHVCDKVPPERRTTPPPLQIFGPIFENIKYMDDNSVLYELFEELLARSIDSERIVEAHPAFIHIISQLSHDEAIILLELRNNDFDLVEFFDIDRETNHVINRIVEECTLPKKGLQFPDTFEIGLDHLESLGLILMPKIKKDIIREEYLHVGSKLHMKIHLTGLGEFFVNACVPEDGFRNK